MRSIFYFFSLTLIVAFLGPSLATAQSDRGAIAGTVKDSTGAVLPGARVELQQKGPSAVSDAQGQFTLIDIAPGKYTLRVSASGFALFSTDLTVSSGAQVHVDAVLPIGTQNQAITVSRGRPNC